MKFILEASIGTSFTQKEFKTNKAAARHAWELSVEHQLDMPSLDWYFDHPRDGLQECYNVMVPKGNWEPDTAFIKFMAFRAKRFGSVEISDGGEDYIQITKVIEEEEEESAPSRKTNSKSSNKMKRVVQKHRSKANHLTAMGGALVAVTMVLMGIWVGHKKKDAHTYQQPAASGPITNIHIVQAPLQRDTPSNTTSTQQNTSSKFRIKLAWSNRSCWQEDCQQDPHWCLQCEGFRCNVGDSLWMEPCRGDLPEQQLFEWIPVPYNLLPSQKDETDSEISSMNDMSIGLSQSGASGNRNQKEWGQIRSGWIANTANSTTTTKTNTSNQGLCLERVSSRGSYELRYCSPTHHRQWFHAQNLLSGEPFELHDPPTHWPPRVDDNTCLSIPHHPRHFETLYHTSCKEARWDRTNLWQVIYGTGNNSFTFQPADYYRIGERRRNPRCLEKSPCGLCEGNCENDNQCEANLRCFLRNRHNPTQTPPGCFGSGVPGMNYCYAVDGN